MPHDEWQLAIHKLKTTMTSTIMMKMVLMLLVMTVMLIAAMTM